MIHWLKEWRRRRALSREFRRFVTPELVEQLASEISGKPLASRVRSTALRMSVNDVFTIHDRGSVLAGTIEAGRAYVGQAVLVRSPRAATASVIAGVEVDRQSVSEALAGQSAAILLRNFDEKAVADGFPADESNAVNPEKCELLVLGAP